MAACLVALLFMGTAGLRQWYSRIITFLPLFFMSELPPYATWLEKFGQIHLPADLYLDLYFSHHAGACHYAVVLQFAEPYFSFTDGMMSLDPNAYSMQMVSRTF
jgi:putative spermidine/putrescine transport system permease protein